MPLLQQTPQGALLAVKAVPGSSRPGVKGLLGDALKVAVASPPEKGKANRELCETLAAHFGLPPASVTVQSGHGSPRKTVLLAGLSAEAAHRQLAQA